MTNINGSYESCLHKWSTVGTFPHPEKEDYYIREIVCERCGVSRQVEVPNDPCPECGE